jgi:cytoskeletal protein RodZ
MSGPGQPAPGEHFGAWLQRERLERAVDLGELAHATKIPRRSLERLEAADLAALPARVFVRGFIRAYAQALGIDPQPALYRLEHAESGASGAGADPPSSTGDRALPLHPRARVGVALAVVVILLVVVVARWL